MLTGIAANDSSQRPYGESDRDNINNTISDDITNNDDSCNINTDKISLNFLKQ